MKVTIDECIKCSLAYHCDARKQMQGMTSPWTIGTISWTHKYVYIRRAETVQHVTGDYIFVQIECTRKPQRKQKVK